MSGFGRLPDGTAPSVPVAGATSPTVADAKVRIGGLADPLHRCWSCGGLTQRHPMGADLTVEVTCRRSVDVLGSCTAPTLRDPRLLDVWHRFDAYMRMVPTDPGCRKIIERVLTEMATILP